jgi:hypothetical protein
MRIATIGAALGLASAGALGQDAGDLIEKLRVCRSWRIRNGCNV